MAAKPGHHTEGDRAIPANHERTTSCVRNRGNRVHDRASHVDHIRQVPRARMIVIDLEHGPVQVTAVGHADACGLEPVQQSRLAQRRRG